MDVHLLFALVWCGIGAYGVYIYLHHRRYVPSLPESTGNNSLRRAHGLFLGGAIVCVILGIWQFAKLFKILR